MKRTLGALLLTLGLAALPIHAADAAPTLKPCQDLQAPEGDYNTLTGQAAFGVSFSLAGPSCTKVDYVVRILDTAGNELNRTTLPGDGVFTSNSLLVAPPAGAPAPGSVCAEVFTGAGKKVYETAPPSNDAECVTGMYFVLDGGSGGRPMG